MANGEIRALGRVSGEALAERVGVVRGVHEAVASRTFGLLGPVALPVRFAHDLIAGGVYGLLEGTHRTIPRLLATGVASYADEDELRVSSSPAGNFALGVLNGIRGDALVESGNELAFPMTLRQEGENVEPERPALERAFPHPTSRIVVFLHGLCETDRSWFSSGSRDRDDPPTSYGLRLQQDLGYTALYVRYNTGLHISDNGRALAQLLDRVVKHWPCSVREIALVGHSMGGLVVRSACHQGALEGYPWVNHVRHVFCLATPHLGSHIEQGANVVGSVLDRFPETRPFARTLKSRSVGIKDLRFGSCLESDWIGHDPDEHLKNRCQEVPFLKTANYYFIGVTVTRDAEHPLGQLFGDLLVQLPSASGKGRRRVLPFEIDNGRHVGGLHHFHLLNHDAIYDQLRQWLERSTELLGASS